MDDSTEFCPSAEGNPIWDVEVYLPGEVPHRFQIKTTGPLWPRADSSVPNFGDARRVLTLDYGKGVTNFGQKQADFLGEEFADNKRLIPKRRLLRAAAVGVRHSLQRTSEKYSIREAHEFADVELLIYVWGLSHWFVKPNEFRALCRLSRRAAPTKLFKAVHVFGAEAGQLQRL